MLRDLNCVQDNTESARLSLNVLVESLNRLKCPEENVEGLCREFADAVRASRPGNTLLMHLLDFFESDLGNSNSREPGCMRLRALESLEEKIDQLDRYGRFVAENGLAYINEGDTIFVLQADKVIEDILIQARNELEFSFRVVLLDRSGEGARRAKEALAEAGIDAQILPPGKDPDGSDGTARLFMGGMTVTADQKILAPKDTAAMVDRFRSTGGTVYFVAPSLWFSPQRSTVRNAFGGGGKEVSLAAADQDMVCLDRVDHIVTELGEMGADGRVTKPPVSLARLKAGTDGTAELISSETARREMSAA
ncbi:MAG: hypothetical protein HUN04_07860 [Desulfobacter sp.]|nr:MAG: hypothetical protein HUN04_07860 [Desulfobacter sp.]